MSPRQIPDPGPDLKKQVAAVLVAEVAGWQTDNAGAGLGADYSAASKIRNGDLRRFSLHRLIRMAAAAGIEAQLTLTRPDDVPGRRGGNGAERARRRVASREALARDPHTAPGIRVTIILDEALVRQAHASTGIVDLTALIHAALRGTCCCPTGQEQSCGTP